jgi:N-acyl-D-aspartate/D-glutamate deacylase
MLDLLLKDASVVDGSGRCAHPSDIGVKDGRIVEIGGVDESATRTIDIGGLVVAPGFIDVHTHYDAQVFWDGTLSPSPLHGVTTVIGGNCGFTIAPLDERDADYLMRMLSRVEGMPLETLQEGVPWDWRTTAEYLDRIAGRLVPNAGFLVGHSALRRAVLHEDAVGSEASEGQIANMQQLLRDGLAAGALGFSSTWSTSHNDHDGNPVPSRWSTREEMLALCGVLREFPGTTLEFIPGVAPFDEDLFDLMASMSRVADRPLNWNVLQVYGKNRDLVEHQLSASDYAESHGGHVVALTLPDTLRNRINFKSGFILDILPGWASDMALPSAQKLAKLADPATRAEMNNRAQTMTGPARSVANWSGYLVRETFVPDAEHLIGRTIGDIASERGTTPWDALADLVVADELRTVIEYEDRGQDDASWARRVEVWRDPRTVIGASDAGAHVDMIDSFGFATTVLARAVRERSLLSMEEAIHLLTARPAALYGLRDRGTIRPGAWADLVVIDPDTIGPDAVSTRYDLPGNAARVYGGATGIERVFVAGVEVVAGKEFTDARPGKVLRGGSDTDLVTAKGPAGVTAASS